MVWGRNQLLNTNEPTHLALLNGFRYMWEWEWDENIIDSPIHEQVENRADILQYSKDWVVSMRDEDFLMEMEPGETINFDTTPEDQ